MWNFCCEAWGTFGTLGEGGVFGEGGVKSWTPITLSLPLHTTRPHTLFTQTSLHSKRLPWIASSDVSSV